MCNGWQINQQNHASFPSPHPDLKSAFFTLYEPVNPNFVLVELVIWPKFCFKSILTDIPKLMF